jgi:sulfhydrogenase subunit delta
MSDKLRVGIFGMTSCYGCQLEIINLGKNILPLLNYLDIVYWRLAQETPSNPTNLDIAIIEGSASNYDEIEELKEIRENSKIVIAIGACANLGGVQGMRNLMDNNQVKAAAYGKDTSSVRETKVKAIHEVIKVDYCVRGCPINRDEFASTILSLIAGRKPYVWKMPVCNECKIKGNECFFERDKNSIFFRSAICLGPITEAGCGARCPSNGMPCDGCRGWTEDAHISLWIKEGIERGESLEDIVMTVRRYSGGTLDQDLRLQKEMKSP